MALENDTPKSNWLERLQQRNIDNQVEQSQTDAPPKVEEQPISDVQRKPEEIEVVESLSQEINNRNNDAGLEDANGNNPTESENEGTPQGDSETENDNVVTESVTEKNWWEDEGSDNVDKATQDSENVQDFSSLSNALGIEGKTKDEIVENFNSLKEKVTEYEAQIASAESNSKFANDEIRVANEISSNGGDWKSYLQIADLDWNNVPDDALLVEFQLKPIYGDDSQSIEAALKDYSPHQLKKEAHTLRQELVQEQSQELNRIKKDSFEKKERINSSIKNQLSSVKDMYGMKITDGMKKDLFGSITSEDFINSIFYDNNGEFNAKAVVETAFLVKNIKNIVKTNVNNARNQGIKQVMDEVSQPNLNRNGSYAAPKQEKRRTLMDHALGSLKGK